MNRNSEDQQVGRAIDHPRSFPPSSTSPPELDLENEGGHLLRGARVRARHRLRRGYVASRHGGPSGRCSSLWWNRCAPHRPSGEQARNRQTVTPTLSEAKERLLRGHRSKSPPLTARCASSERRGAHTAAGHSTGRPSRTDAARASIDAEVALERRSRPDELRSTDPGLPPTRTGHDDPRTSPASPPGSRSLYWIMPPMDLVLPPRWPPPRDVDDLRL
jgi:hypothetical protein